MKKILFLSAALCIITLGSCNKKRATYEYPFQNPELSIDDRVEDIINRLTLEEKVAQLMDATPAVERLGIPEYDWWNEALHGVARAGKATVFPQSIAMASVFDEEAILKTFTIVSDEARAKYHQFQRDKEYDRYKGLTFWTPNINIFRDPRWGRGMETYGEDPYLTSRLGVSVVKGLQGDDPKYLKTHACAKHYAVHSGPEWNRHSYDAYVSPRDLRTTYLPAFETLVKEGNVQEVMCAYNRFEGQPCCGSNKLLVDILRNEWGYNNIIVSDCGAIDDFWQKDKRTPRHETHADAATASIDAIRHGTDVECGGSYKSLVEAVKNGQIKEEELNVSLRRLFRGRMELGLFDPDEIVPYASIPYSIVECEDHIAASLEMARKCMVLLKNGNNTLPLSKDLKKIAVVGPNATDSTMLWANYNGFPTHTVTILEGIREKLPDAEVIYEQGCNLTDAVEGITPALAASKVKSADVIIFVGGLSPRLEGEEMRVMIEGFRGGDRTDTELPKIQREVLKALKATGKPVVFVVCTGSALSLTWENDNLDAILNAWYGGQQAGTAVADILFGDCNPSGKLPITFYKSIAQVPDFEDYSMKGRTYRYMTEEPLYPFGEITEEDNVTLSVPVTNTGTLDGDEVIQVYVRNPNDAAAPLKTLKGFRRVHLKAGETVSTDITLETDAFQSFNDAEQAFEVRKGKYALLYGASSADKDLKSIELTIK